MNSGTHVAQESPESAFRFDAFLSYSRKDLDFAKCLEKALNSYLPPRDLPVPHRRLRVFRDQTDICGVELTQALDSNLRNSAKLIVLCSPDSRASPYVNHEIEVFGSMRGPEHILPILVRGLPNNEASPERESELAFPRALIALLQTPLASEFRGFRPGKDRIGRGAYEQGWFKTLADVYSAFGVTRAQVEQREKRRQARQRTLLTSVTAAIMLALLVLTAWALNERNEAIRQRNTAVSRQLASQSAGLVSEKPDVALLLAAAAYQNAPTCEARQSLLASFLARPRLKRFLWGHTGSVACLAFSPDGRRLASGGGDDGKVVVWDTAQGSILFEAVADPKVVQSVVFGPNGQRMISAGKEGQIKVWDAATGTLLLTFGRIGDFLETMALSPDGSRLATGLWSGQLDLWDTVTGKQVAAAKPYTGMIRCVAFNPSGDWIASGSSDGTAALWDGSSDHTPRTLPGHSRGVKHLAFRPDGTILAAAFGVGQVNLWQVDSAQLQQTLSAPETDHDAGEGASVVFSPDGRLLALSGTLGRTATVWDLDGGGRVARLSGGPNGIHSIAFSHRGDRFAFTGGDGVVRLWETGQWSAMVAPVGGFGPLAFSPDDRTLATGGRDRAALWEVEEPSILTSFTPHADRVGRIQFSPDGKYLASASPDRDVAIWEVAVGRLVGRYQPPKEPNADLEPVLRGRDLRVFAFGPDGRTLATGGRQGQRFGEGGRRGDLVVWEFAGSGRTNLLTGHNSGLAAVAYSHDGKQLASSDSSSIRLWNLTTGQALMLRESQGALVLVFDPAATKLAAGSGDDVLVWDLKSRGEPSVLRGHERPVAQLRFSPDGRILVSGSFDGTLRFWDTRRPESVLVGVGRHSGDIRDLAMSRDGRVVVSGSRDHTLGVWDARTGTLIRRLMGHDSEVASVDLSADGTMIASAGEDGTVILWDLATGTELVRLGRQATRVAFSPKDSLLATGGGADRQVSLWNIDLRAWADRACSMANRNLSLQEWRQYLGTIPYQAICPTRPHPPIETSR